MLISFSSPSAYTKAIGIVCSACRLIEVCNLVADFLYLLVEAGYELIIIFLADMPGSG